MVRLPKQRRTGLFSATQVRSLSQLGIDLFTHRRFAGRIPLGMQTHRTVRTTQPEKRAPLDMCFVQLVVGW